MNNTQSLEILKGNCQMLYKSLNETKLRGNFRAAEVMETAFKESLDTYVNAGGKEEDIISEDDINDDMIDSYAQTTLDLLSEKTNTPVNNAIVSSPVTPNPEVNQDKPVTSNSTTIKHDVIPLPSNGECYKNKIKSLSVAYLTASDEDLIMSPNLYNEGTVIDYILKEKILDKTINPDDLCKGDRDAIILWLRATAYDPSFPVLVKDPETDEDIEATVDLSQIKTKDFTLKGDENGWFDFVLPKSGDTVKFKFLTRRDEKNIDMINKIESERLRKIELKNIIHKLNTFIKNESVLASNVKPKTIQAIKTIMEWCDAIPDKESMRHTRAITNMLELSIMSINGNSDRKFISNYIKNMIAYDSLELRRYITKNEPGMDFLVDAQKSPSLGGGSIKTFLTIDNTIFLNVSGE